jgi:hypothetical protein
MNSFDWVVVYVEMRKNLSRKALSFHPLSCTTHFSHTTSQHTNVPLLSISMNLNLSPWLFLSLSLLTFQGCVCEKVLKLFLLNFQFKSRCFSVNIFNFNLLTRIWMSIYVLINFIMVGKRERIHDDEKKV